jgi:phosphate transport system ATP-binding protein
MVAPAPASPQGDGSPALAPAPQPDPEPVLRAENTCIYYGPKRAVTDVNLRIETKQVTAFIGPSGCGKTTLLRTFNRMNDLIPGVRVEGRLLYHGDDLYGRGVDPVEVRRRIGMVFQKPNPFPKSIHHNITWGPLINGLVPRAGRRAFLDELVERCLRGAGLWDEVKDRLDESGMALSGGQQQRLCIARALAMSPEVVLMDEPCSALDPRSTQRIEDLIAELGNQYTIIIVTHNMQQAARVSDYTAFFYVGSLIEYGPTDRLFQSPREQQTADYITGRFG